MNTLIFLFIWGWCCVCINGAVFDPYSRRYNLRNGSFETLFPTTAKNDFQSKINAAPVIDNVRCKNAYQFASASTLDQLINLQYELIELCPKVYESFRYTNITTWGPVEEFMQIWYMRFVDALWLKIQSRTSTCHCVLYDDFITAAQTSSDTVLLQYLQSNYDPTLCEINDQTMYKWHQLLQRPQIKNKNTNFLKVGDFSIQVVQAIAKSYLTDARYDSYFEATPEYPLLTYFTATLSSPSYTTTQKGFIKQLATYFKQQFPTLTLANRKDIFSKKFTESIDLSYSYFKCLNSIPLDPADGITHYDLLLYVTRKDFLIAKRIQYSSTPTTACVITTTTKKPSTTTTSTTRIPTTTTPITTTTKATTTSTTTKNPTTSSATTTPSMTSTTTVCETTITTVPLTPTTTTFLTTTTTKPTTTAFPTTSTTPTTTTTSPTTTTTATPSTTTTTPTTTSTTTTPLTTTISSTTTTTTPCSAPLNAAEIFIGVDVVLIDDFVFPKANPVGTCNNSPNGYTAYYNGSTPADFSDYPGTVWVGQWIRRTNCASPCICASTSCYVPDPGNPSLDPNILLYPHCLAPNQCFIAAVIGSSGALVNPSDPNDSFYQQDQTIADINDPSYPKVISVGCGGCPVSI